MASAKLNERQRRFCKEYIVDCNATQAAIRAGYSEKTAYSIGQQQLKKIEVQKSINELMTKKDDNTIATADEVLRYLTSAMRGEIIEECVTVESVGNFQSEARIIEKQISPKDRNKAADSLAKRYGLLTDNINLQGEVAVKIVDDIPDE